MNPMSPPALRSEAFFEDIEALRSPGMTRRAHAAAASNRLDRLLRLAPLVAGLLCVVAALATLAL